MACGSLHETSTVANYMHTQPSTCLGSTQDASVSHSYINKEVECDIKDLLEDVPQLADVFDIKDKIGAGTFSSVYLGVLKSCPSRQFALKHLIPTSHPSRIEKELLCLKELRGQDYVIAVEACVRHDDHVVVVMPYFEHDRFQNYVQDMTVSEIREYMRALLTALRHVHKFNIIHRDIKHSNFLYNRKLKQYALVDFGLAQKVPEPVMKVPIGSASCTQSTASPKTVLSPSPRKKVGTTNENVNSQTDSVNGNLADTSVSPAMRLSVDDQGDKVELSKGLLQPLSPNVEFCRPVSDRVRPAPSLDLKTVASSKICDKSPRRVLLTKRTLDYRRQAAQNAAVQSADSGKRLEKHLESSKKSDTKTIPRVTCRCFGRPMVCSICLARSTERAPRAGTPGYRAPEVLMKFPDQTTAVDIWSAGVIFLSLLSGHYPIFKANDDIEALMQIMCLFGSEELKVAAKSYSKQLDCNPTVPPVDLKALCLQLRRRTDDSSDLSSIPDTAFDLLRHLLDLNPFARITAEAALKHSFFSELSE